VHNEVATLANGWTFNVMNHLEILPKQGVIKALDLLERWKGVFPLGETWVGREYGVPSLLVRLDCVYDPETGLQVFEIEERPCGAGAAMRLNPSFAVRFSALRNEWPPFSWVSDPTRRTDDEEWLGMGLSLEEAKQSDGLLLVRSRPEHTDYHVLEQRAISSVRHAGDKSYGVEMGLWHIGRWRHDPSEDEGGYIDPPLSGACVLKPLQGTRCRGVMVYLTGHTVQMKVNGRGLVTHYNGEELIKVKQDTAGSDRIGNTLRNSSDAYVCQPFIQPMRRSFVPDKNVILRFFFGFSPNRREYVPLGGVWAASEALRVHGEKDTVFGPLDFAE